jgi:4-amino-4-deoxy-L-arabinose transferase-like glycosyltransferase
VQLAPTSPTSDTAPPAPRSFGRALTAIVVGAIAVRIAAVYSKPATLGFSDPLYYYLQARELAHGRWFIDGIQYAATHTPHPSALHPPFYTLYLTAVRLLGVTTIRGEEIATALLGVATVVACVLAARRLAGPRAGLIAGCIAALLPDLWSTERKLLSESMVALLAALVVITGVAYADRPTARRALALGAVVSLLALTRGEGVLLFPLLVVPLVTFASRGGPRRVLTSLLAVAAAAALIIGPWAVFNMSRFDAPVVISNNFGGVLADSSCNFTFNGPNVGWWDGRCLFVDLTGDESQQDRELRHRAFRYMGKHEGELPRVVALRIGRLTQLYRPWQTARLEGFEGRGPLVARVGAAAWFALLPFAIAGVVLARHRRRSITPIVALIAVSVITGGIFYGGTRFRIIADVALVISAGVALDAVWERLRRPVRAPAEALVGPNSNRPAPIMS